MMTMGSLFDGIGGFPLAARRNGIATLWASEIEPFPIRVTKLRFPEMVHLGDITKLDGAKLPPVDIICGGSPCQDLSVAGARAGLAGSRSGLFMEQIRIIREMRDADKKRGRTGLAVRPRFGCWENVLGAFSSAEGKTFRLSSRRLSGSRSHRLILLDLRPGAGNLLGPYWEYDPPWLGPPGTLNTSESPNGGAGSSLSQILQDTVPSKYYLSKAACLGILRRAEQRGKALPPQLKEALELQAGVSSPSTSTSGRRP